MRYTLCVCVCVGGGGNRWPLEFAAASLGDLFAHEPCEEEAGPAAASPAAATVPAGPRKIDLSRRVVLAKRSRKFPAVIGTLSGVLDILAEETRPSHATVEGALQVTCCIYSVAA